MRGKDVAWMAGGCGCGLYAVGEWGVPMVLLRGEGGVAGPYLVDAEGYWCWCRGRILWRETGEEIDVVILEVVRGWAAVAWLWRGEGRPPRSLGSLEVLWGLGAPPEVYPELAVRAEWLLGATPLQIAYLKTPQQPPRDAEMPPPARALRQMEETLWDMDIFGARWLEERVREARRLENEMEERRRERRRQEERRREEARRGVMPTLLEASASTLPLPAALRPAGTCTPMPGMWGCGRPGQLLWGEEGV